MRSEVRRLPAAFLERLRKIVPRRKWDEIANTFTEPKPTTFRINTLRTESVRARHASPLEERLCRQGFRLEKVPWYPEAFILQEGRLRDLQKTEIYQKGGIYVQSLSSMIPPLVLDPRPGERILDLTAAPGSKTTQMACLMKGEGEIVANDNSRIRFFKLKANVELQGAGSVKLSLRHGESIGRSAPESFDRVLLDAPCSAEGRFNVRDPSTYRYWKPAKIKEMVRKQKRLVLSAMRALKPGGVLVYSTCTFAPEENEGVVNWLLEKSLQNGPLVIASSAARGGGTKQPHIEKISFPVSNQTPGLTQWEGRTFHPSLRHALRILPTPLMEGFFLVCIRKSGP